jgi:hypothetical protein
VSCTLRLRRTAGAAAAAAIAAGTVSVLPLAVAPPAQAATGSGSIVFVKDHDVWITDGDGSVVKRVTSGGTAADPWQSPTQSDDGVVVAHHSGLVYRMNQRGEVLSSFDPPDLLDSIGNQLSGRSLTETAVSPDGTRIAYTYASFYQGLNRWVTGFTDATQVVAPTVYGVSYYDKPSWVTNSRVVVNAWYRNNAHLVDLGQRDISWFGERYYESTPKELSDLEVSRDGRWITGVRGDVGDQSIVVLEAEGDVQTTTRPWVPTFGVTRYCDIGRQDGTLREPTIAPDGTSVAWAEPGGIYRTSDMDCDDQTRTDVLVAAGGSDPSWSAAEIGRTPDVTGPAGPGPVQPGSVQPGAAFALGTRPAVVGKARVGRTLKVKVGSWSPAPQSFTYAWTRDAKPIRKATKPRYRITARDRGHRITVSVTGRRAGLPDLTTTTRPVRVRR